MLATRDIIAVRQPESFGEIFAAIKKHSAEAKEAAVPQSPLPSRDDDDDDDGQVEGMDVD